MLIKLTVMRQEIITWLENNVSAKRLKHILGVEATAVKLAQIHQADPTKAAMAGIMHDLAKFFPPSRLLEMATENQIPVDSICQNQPHLLHAEASAIVAQQEFGVTDATILNAIRNHTLGSPDMDLLSCIVFVADCIEPNRGDNAELEKIRSTSQENLYLAVVQTCDYSLKYLISSFRAIHPRSVMTRNWALNLVKQ